MVAAERAKKDTFKPKTNHGRKAANPGPRAGSQI